MATDEKPPFEKFAMMFWNKQLQDLIKEKISIQEQWCIPYSSHLASPQVILSTKLAHDIRGIVFLTGLLQLYESQKDSYT